MRTLAPCVYSTLHATHWHHSARPVAATRLLSVGDPLSSTLGEEQDFRYTSNAPVRLKEIFAPRRAPRDSYGSDGSSARPGAEGLGIGGKAVALHRLDRLQEVANLALEDREGLGGGWGCADIGADHGLLAICLHANGANVIAGDRAAGPLDVARENVRLYLRYAEEAPAPAAAPTVLTSSANAGNVDVPGNGALISSTYAGNADVAGSGRPGREAPDAAGVPRLECRLGDGLAVLEAGEVDTVCIAGVGVKTMIHILSARGHGSENSGPGAPGGGALLSLGVQRLVLQPMDPRLEYLRDLRVWLRENGWRIVQETIVSTSGKGGNHAFVTLRADLAKPDNQEDQEHAPTPPATYSVEWPGGQQDQSDWLGDFLLARSVDGGQTPGGGGKVIDNRSQALTFIAYLRHQRDWLRAIERARAPREGVVDPESPVVAGVNSALAAVTEAVQAGVGEGLEEDGGGRDRLVTARRWQKFAAS